MKQSSIHPLFQSALKAFTPPATAVPSGTICTECHRELPKVYFGSTNWMQHGVCSAPCWDRLNMERAA